VTTKKTGARINREVSGTSVERRLRQYAQTVTRQLQDIDQDSLLHRILGELPAEAPASDDDRINRRAVHPQVDGPPGPSFAGEGPTEKRLTFELTGGFEQELYCHQQLAEKGIASSARRVAELCGLLDRENEEAAWWRRAAELGDPDAVDYVQEYLTQPVDKPSFYSLNEATDQMETPTSIVHRKRAEQCWLVSQVWWEH
jgi:hypothetical protein